MSLDRYRLGEVLCVQWNPEMADRFPNADHRSCRQEMQANLATNRWEPFDPPRCMGYHCNRCGQPTNTFGHHDKPCEDRP